MSKSIRHFAHAVSAITCSVLVLSAGSVRAQDRNAIIMQKLYSKIEAQLGVGDPNDFSHIDALVLAAPGFPIDSSIDFGTPDGRKKVYDLLDHALQPSWMMRFDDQTTSGIYSHILQDKEYPVIRLTPIEQQKLDDARARICSDAPRCRHYTQDYKYYLNYKSAFAAASEAIEDWQNAHPDQDTPPPTLQDQWNRAQADYYGKGQANIFLGAEQDRDNIENRDPAVFWQRLQEQYDNNLMHVGVSDVPIYEFYPTYQTWLSSATHWTKISLTDADLNQVATSSHTSWGGGFSAGWGLWSAGGSYGKTEDRTSLTNDAQHFSVQFEVTRVAVVRPWMDPSVYGAHTWRWAQGKLFSGRQISDGIPTDGSAPTGLEPMRSTEILLARNVSLSGDWGTSLKTTYSTTQQGGGHVGWGPFSFGGNYSSTYNSATDHTQVTDNSISNPDVQIIGMLVKEVEKTPDPDMTLTWSSTPIAARTAPATVALVQAMSDRRKQQHLIDAATAIMSKVSP